MRSVSSRFSFFSFQVANLEIPAAHLTLPWHPLASQPTLSFQPDPALSRHTLLSTRCRTGAAPTQGLRYRAARGAGGRRGCKGAVGGQVSTAYASLFTRRARQRARAMVGARGKVGGADAVVTASVSARSAAQTRRERALSGERDLSVSPARLRRIQPVPRRSLTGYATMDVERCIGEITAQVPGTILSDCAGVRKRHFQPAYPRSHLHNALLLLPRLELQQLA